MGNDEATLYVGGLPSRATEELLKEMFTQAGPVAHLTLKKTATHSYALVEFKDEDSVPFALEIMDGVKLFNTAINVKPRNNTKQEEAWKKGQQTRRNGGAPEVFLPQLDRGDRGRDGPRMDMRQPPPFIPGVIPGMPILNIGMGLLPPPPPPPPIMGYASPSTRIQPGFKIGRINRDNWHTPPNRDMLNPRIPPQYENRQRSNDIRSDTRPDRGWNDDRRRSGDQDRRRSHNDHRQRYNPSQRPPQNSGGRRY